MKATQHSFSLFLVTCTQLNKTIYQSIGPFVSPSVRPLASSSIRWSVGSLRLLSCWPCACSFDKAVCLSVGPVLNPSLPHLTNDRDHVHVFVSSGNRISRVYDISPFYEIDPEMTQTVKKRIVSQNMRSIEGVFCE